MHRRESALLAGAVLADSAASPPPPPGAAASGVGARRGVVRVDVLRMGVRLSLRRYSSCSVVWLRMHTSVYSTMRHGWPRPPPVSSAHTCMSAFRSKRR